MKRTFLTAAAGFLLCSAAFCDSLRPEDFAFGFTVQAEGGGALLELPLPDEVYSGVFRPDLGDLRVFNQAGEVVPHAIRQLPASSAEAPPPVDLPFFALRADPSTDAGKHVLHIVTDAGGAIIEAASEPLHAQAPDRVAAYLVDASRLVRGPIRLDLQWKHAQPGGFAATVDVLASDDLSHWTTLVADATLADLHSGEATLVHNEIVLSGRKAQYLRIAWPDAMREIRLTRVRAYLPAEQAPPPRRWMEIERSTDEGDAGGWVFNSNAYRPIDQARILFPLSNVVLRGSLYSRPTDDANWRPRFAGVVYALDYAGTRLESGPIALGPTTDRHWRFVPDGKQGSAIKRPPRLGLGGTPHHLTLVAQGEGPYAVAFGSATAAPSERPLETLLRDIGATQGQGLTAAARASPVFILGGEERLRPPPAPIPWKQWLLWGVLVAGVSMLALMVQRLLRQLRPPGDPGGSPG
jgi:hypothetical protein